jgi:hypothetical protein
VHDSGFVMAPLFFVPFMAVATYFLLNLLLAVVSAQYAHVLGKYKLAAALLHRCVRVWASVACTLLTRMQ